MTLVICACSAALNPEKSMTKERFVNSCDGCGVTWSESRVQSLSVGLSIPGGEPERTWERGKWTSTDANREAFNEVTK